MREWKALVRGGVIREIFYIGCTSCAVKTVELEKSIGNERPWRGIHILKITAKLTRFLERITPSIIFMYIDQGLASTNVGAQALGGGDSGVSRVSVEALREPCF